MKFGRKFVLGGLTVMMILSLFGCGKKSNMGGNYKAGSVEEKFYNQLYKKYGEEFVIESVSNEAGVSFGQKGTYEAVVKTQNEENTFNASLDQNGKNLIDNYAGVVFKDEIEKLIEDITDKNYDFTLNSVSFNNVFSDKDWRNSSFEDYMFNTGSTLDVKISMEAESVNQAYSEVEDFYNILTEENVYYSISCDTTIDGQHMNFYWSKDDNFDVSLDDIKADFERLAGNGKQ